MGDTHITGMGFGIIYERTKELEQAIEKAIDIEFLLADEYPLLSDYHAGNAWSGSITSMILITSTVQHDYSFFIETDSLNTSPSEKDITELMAFCKRFSLDFKPSWKIFSYLG